LSKGQSAKECTERCEILGIATVMLCEILVTPWQHPEFREGCEILGIATVMLCEILEESDPDRVFDCRDLAISQY